MRRPSRHIAFARDEGSVWESGRKAGHAAAAAIRMPRRGAIRDRVMLAHGHGFVRRPRHRCAWVAPSSGRYRRLIERLVTSHAARILYREEERRFRRLW